MTTCLQVAQRRCARTPTAFSAPPNFGGLPRVVRSCHWSAGTQDTVCGLISDDQNFSIVPIALIVWFVAM